MADTGLCLHKSLSAAPKHFSIDRTQIWPCWIQCEDCNRRYSHLKNLDSVSTQEYTRHNLHCYGAEAPAHGRAILNTETNGERNSVSLYIDAATQPCDQRFKASSPGLKIKLITVLVKVRVRYRFAFVMQYFWTKCVDSGAAGWKDHGFFLCWNEITCKGIYCLQWIDGTLDCLLCEKFSLSLRSSCWYVPMAEDDSAKTACIALGTLSDIMTFGLCDAPATFECMRNNILCGINGRHGFVN